MDLSEFLTQGGVAVVLVLSMIQIAPVKINPWTAIARSVGRAMNVEVMEKLDEHGAETARYRILRFDDEIRHSVRHSEEHFNQIIEEIDKYEAYCKEHPKFPNEKAKLAMKNIRTTWEKCRNEKSFLI